ncbi:MAG TPA: MFS transporter [Pyrinomonadaceae bacterium]|nr:MFS transporter [Pyrinomonadaceae bacterium]
MTQKQSGLYYALFVLFLINALNFFDRQIIGAVGEPIRREFGLDDKALGALNTAFTLLYAFVGLPLGRLADAVGRKWILSIGVFFWSLFTAASGLAQSFWQIFALRLGVGVGEASCAPAANSLIGDYFPAEQRARASSVFMLGLPVGLALSFAVSGAVARNYGWRAAFLIAGLPGLICVALALFIREPARGAVETANVGTKKREGSSFRLVLSSPTMRWLILSGALHNFNMYAMGAFITPYLMRFHGADIQYANNVSALIYGLIGAPGLLLGGFLGSAALKKRADGQLLVATLAILFSVPFLFLALGVSSGNILAFSVLIGISFALMYFYYSTVYATISDITEPGLRGTSMAIYFLAMYLLGASLGPYIIGAISDYYTQQAAISAGITNLTEQKALEPFRAAGLRSAMYVVPVLSSFLILVLFAASRTVKGDVEKLQKWMRESFGKDSTGTETAE